MSTTERLIEYHLARLKDKSPAVRLQSIQELVLLEATDALGALEALYREDPDPAVRRAAQQAGRVLFAKGREQGSPPVE